MIETDDRIDRAVVEKIAGCQGVIQVRAVDRPE